MLENLENMYCAPIPVMLHDHDTGRQYVKGIEEALKNRNAESMIQHATDHYYLLQDHIYKEDNILYLMAEEALNEEQKQQVDLLYNKVNIEDFFEKEINF